jgi:tRNA-2-methylthio-N6-dimethylallyladenosine synthase
MTSHPKDAGEDLFKAMRDLPKVCKHLHLPLQSGSDKILKLMDRGYTSKRYFRLIEKLKEYVPDCNVTTDIIVGFPGETEVDFKKTYDLMKKIKFDAAYIFKYSPRSPAASCKFKDDVAQEEKERRNQLLLQLQRRIKNEKN